MSAFWADVYRNHFKRWFQKPFDVQVYHNREGFSLKLATHDLAQTHFRVYASLGLADKLADRDDDFGEVILYADVPDPAVPQIFVQALFFILDHELPLSERFAIGGIESMQPGFAKRYQKSALYFTLAPDEEEKLNRVRNGEEFGRVYQAYFIAPAEHQYWKEYGADAFEKKFFETTEGRTSVRRPSFA